MTAPRLNPAGLLAGSAWSALAHILAGAGLYGWLMAGEASPIVAELDLSMAPPVAAAPAPGGGRTALGEREWAMRDSINHVEVRPVPETKEEVLRAEDGSACAGACPEGKGEGAAEGEAGQGLGGFIPAEQASRGPRWIRNFITSSDYPAVARREGRDGRVILSVWIGRDGRVVDTQLIEGSYDVLNEVAIRKARQAVFRPAYDQDGKPVPCKITLPIRFELR